VVSFAQPCLRLRLRLVSLERQVSPGRPVAFGSTRTNPARLSPATVTGLGLGLDVGVSLVLGLDLVMSPLS
jgi:hypothetical protein